MRKHPHPGVHSAQSNPTILHPRNADPQSEAGSRKSKTKPNGVQNECTAPRGGSRWVVRWERTSRSAFASVTQLPARQRPVIRQFIPVNFMPVGDRDRQAGSLDREVIRDQDGVLVEEHVAVRAQSE
jgi:hypothetical protein